jgi:hypothetical protein
MRVSNGKYGYRSIGGQGYQDGTQVSTLMRIDHGYGSFQVRAKPAAAYVTVATVTETGYGKWTINTSSSSAAFGTATALDIYQVTLTLDFTHQTGQFEAVNLTNTAQAPSTSSFNFAGAVSASDLNTSGEFVGLAAANSTYVMTFDNLAVNEVPEPTSAALVVGSIGALALKRRRRV